MGEVCSSVIRGIVPVGIADSAVSHTERHDRACTHKAFAQIAGAIGETLLDDTSQRLLALAGNRKGVKRAREKCAWVGAVFRLTLCHKYNF